MGLDGAGTPRNQQHQEEQHGQSDTDGQGPQHAPGVPLVPIEEEESGKETHQDAREQQQHQVLDHI